MVIMSSLSDILKWPLEGSVTGLLGSDSSIKPLQSTPLKDLARKVSSIAKTVFFTGSTLVSTPFWLVGDLVEWVTKDNKPFEDKVHLLDLKTDGELFLDPHKTQHMGFSISTYQNTSDKNFCTGSDWNRYVRERFAGENEHLAPGSGVDVLTKEGRELLADMILEANGNTIRFSVEWAHILKNGSFNLAAMQQYKDAAIYFKTRGITPIITLHHFVTPLDEDGNSRFESSKSIEEFTAFAEFVFKSLYPTVTKYVTFNEPNVHAVMNYVLGDFPAEKKAHFWTSQTVLNNMLEAHKRVHIRLHALANSAPINLPISVGLSHQALLFIPSSRLNLPARIASFVFTHIFHESFMKWAENNRDYLDFLGIQYYTTPLLGGFPPDSTCRKGQKMVEAMRFRFYPEGLLPIIEEIHQRLPNLELLVTETGTAGRNYVEATNLQEEQSLEEMDARRKEYMLTALKVARVAQDSGINLIGFMPWTLFPNFEWNHGFSKTHDFGLVARDQEEIRATEGYEAIKEAFGKTASKKQAAAI